MSIVRDGVSHALEVDVPERLLRVCRMKQTCTLPSTPSYDCMCRYVKEWYRVAE